MLKNWKARAMGTKPAARSEAREPVEDTRPERVPETQPETTPTAAPPRTRQSAAEKTARKAKAAKQGRVKNLKTPDSAITSLVTSLQAKLGRDDVILGTDTDQLFIGLPLPSLALRHLLGNDIWPLSRFARLIGLEGSCKTSFAVEVARWHLLQSGVAGYIEAEVKDSSAMRESILGLELLKKLAWMPADSQEEWQTILMRMLESVEEEANSPGGGLTPYCFIVDSMSGLAAEATIANVHATGSGKKAFPLEALQNANYLKSAPASWRKIPASVIATSHQNIDIGAGKPGQPPAKRTPGGIMAKFMQATEIQLMRVGDIKLASSGGIKLNLKTTKNSNAESRRSINVDLIWHMEETPSGKRRQRSYFDWFSASIDMLFSQRKASASRFTAIQDVLSLQQVSGRRVYSKPLGISKDKPVSFHQAGLMLEERPELLEQLYDILMIRQCNVFVPGTVNYRKAVKKITRAIDIQAHELYRNYERLDTSIGDALTSKVAKANKNYDKIEEE